MKCFNCGNNEFFEGKELLPFGVYGDAYLRVNDNSVYICNKCGNVQIFSKGVVEKYKKQVEELEKKAEELKELEKELDKLQKEPFDEKKHYNRIECINKEIEDLRRLGVEGKAIRAREDEIKDLKNEIKNGIDHKVAHQINNINNKVRELETEIEKLEREKYTTITF